MKLQTFESLKKLERNSWILTPTSRSGGSWIFFSYIDGLFFYVGMYGLFSSLSGGTFPYVSGTRVLIRPPCEFLREWGGNLGVDFQGSAYPPEVFSERSPRKSSFRCQKKTPTQIGAYFLQLVNFRGVCILYITWAKLSGLSWENTFFCKM